MAHEIERKFLVAGDEWRGAAVSATRIVQGYLAHTGRATVRIRVKGEQGYVTIKGATSGITRAEFEYEIPHDDALTMLDTLADGPVVDKVRHIVPVNGHEWEVDVFAGDNEGLVMAELELDAADEAFERPAWAGREVSDDPRYFNVNLAQHPYRSWAG